MQAGRYERLASRGYGLHLARVPTRPSATGPGRTTLVLPVPDLSPPRLWCAAVFLWALLLPSDLAYGAAWVPRGVGTADRNPVWEPLGEVRFENGMAVCRLDPVSITVIVLKADVDPTVPRSDPSRR